MRKLTAGDMGGELLAKGPEATRAVVRFGIYHLYNTLMAGTLEKALEKMSDPQEATIFRILQRVNSIKLSAALYLQGALTIVEGQEQEALGGVFFCDKLNECLKTLTLIPSRDEMAYGLALILNVEPELMRDLGHTAPPECAWAIRDVKARMEVN